MSHSSWIIWADLDCHYASPRAVEQELSDSNEQLSSSVVTNQAITAAKRKMEQEMSTLAAELDEMAAEAAMSEERAAR